MKKIFVVLVAVFALGFAANAQDAIGLRFGGGTALGAEVSFQKGLGSNRLELDLGVSRSTDNYFNLCGIYQWKGNFVDDWFGWYAGPGVNVGYCGNHGLGLAVVGQFGIEFNFHDFPFQLTADVRPQFEFLLPEHCGYRGFGWGGALGIRYKLN